jgi:acid phosphatase family membrane protein YuiD
VGRLASLKGSDLMNLSYLVTPLIAWLVAGSLKFLINSLKAKQLAFGLIGYGGLPSNHTAIVSSMVALIGFQEGFANPAFGVALTLTFIVILDANSLRKQVGKQAATINKIAHLTGVSGSLRERMGHTVVEIVAGIVVGITVAWVTKTVLS